MGGTLYYMGTKPTVGATVFVVVSSTSFPNGLWEGRLVELGQDYPTTREGAAAACVAIVTDPAVEADVAARHRHGKPPSLTYSVYDPLAAVAYLRARRDEDRQKLDDLKARLGIERATFQALFKSIVSVDAVAKLEEVLQKIQKIARLTP